MVSWVLVLRSVSLPPPVEGEPVSVLGDSLKERSQRLPPPK